MSFSNKCIVVTRNGFAHSSPLNSYTLLTYNLLNADSKRVLDDIDEANVMSDWPRVVLSVRGSHNRENVLWLLNSYIQSGCWSECKWARSSCFKIGVSKNYNCVRVLPWAICLNRDLCKTRFNVPRYIDMIDWWLIVYIHILYTYLIYILLYLRYTTVFKYINGLSN
jgi:hypothetical protein